MDPSVLNEDVVDKVIRARSAAAAFRSVMDWTLDSWIEAARDNGSKDPEMFQAQDVRQMVQEAAASLAVAPAAWSSWSEVKAKAEDRPVDENGMAALRARVLDLEPALNMAHKAHEDIERLNAHVAELETVVSEFALDINRLQAELERVSENLATRADRLTDRLADLESHVSDQGDTMRMGLDALRGPAVPDACEVMHVPPGMFLSPYDPHQVRVVILAAERVLDSGEQYVTGAAHDTALDDLRSALNELDPRSKRGNDNG